MGKVMGKLRSGSNSNFWRGGVSSKNRLIRYSAKMENWRKSVFKRDNFTCQDCGRRGCYIEAHHIKSFAYYPKLRFVISNGKTLCRDCHDKTKRRKV
jgi:5-methylcytosine-specific restriction endonuclease McrA